MAKNNLHQISALPCQKYIMCCLRCHVQLKDYKLFHVLIIFFDNITPIFIIVIIVNNYSSKNCSAVLLEINHVAQWSTGCHSGMSNEVVFSSFDSQMSSPSMFAYLHIWLHGIGCSFDLISHTWIRSAKVYLKRLEILHKAIG